MMRFSWRNILLGLAVLTLFLAGPAQGDGMPDSEAPFNDYGSFLGEYQTAGAFRFYDNTEALLRLAQFELALMRYRFLKGQIQRKGDYRGLTAMVDLRLRFLKKQMHLHDGDIAAIPPRKARIPQPKKPPEEKPKDAAAKPTPPGPGDKNKAKAGLPGPGQAPGGTVIPGAPETAVPAPGAMPGRPPEVVTMDTPPQTKEEKAAEAKEAKPPLPPNFWDRMWIRVNPWNKGAAPPPAVSSDKPG
jgi:hypothetical protein